MYFVSLTLYKWALLRPFTRAARGIVLNLYFYLEPRQRAVGGRRFDGVGRLRRRLGRGRLRHGQMVGQLNEDDLPALGPHQVSHPVLAHALAPTSHILLLLGYHSLRHKSKIISPYLKQPA
jgi:hypothetical protein